MYDARPGLDTVNCLSREGSPCRHTQGETYTGPVIDTHRAIAQIGNRPLYCSTDSRVFERVGVDDESGVECAPNLLIGEINGTVDVFSYTCCINRRLGKKATESLSSEAYIVTIGRIDTGNQRPGKLLLRRCSELLGFWM